MPVDDPGAVEVVRRKLAANAIAGEDPDPEAAHLAGHVTEDDVIVVELYAEHRVGQGLDHLTLEFDLVLLRHASFHSARRYRSHLYTSVVIAFLVKPNYQRGRDSAARGGAGGRRSQVSSNRLAVGTHETVGEACAA